jgi:3,4-dihydroxy-9,10-secoandrosta-1,3,5(10)-triene-9,17-dione 4,5-dioxygenase
MLARKSNHRSAPMSKVVANGYLGLTAPDLDEWKTFATDVLGLVVAVGSTEECLRLRIDDREWRFAVSQGEPGVDYVGWEVADEDALAAVAESLNRAGVPFREDPELAKQRNVVAVLTCEDPAGHQLELFHGAQIATDAFVSPRGRTFITADRAPGDLGYGHVVLEFPDPVEAVRFYVDVLGFKVSDTSGAGQGLTGYLRCNPRHHSLGIGPGGDHRKLGHFSLQVEDIDMVGTALDSASDSGIVIVGSLGRHLNDHMISTYIATPSGGSVEYGFGGRLVDDDRWVVSHYDDEASSFWGHRGEWGTED